MPIREESFRIGCGRYLQGEDSLKKLGAEIKRLGKSPLILGGKTALSLTRKTIEETLSNEGIPFEIIEHTGTCNETDAQRYADYAKSNGFDVIVGVGGGVIMDFSKLVANIYLLPVINLPTSAATCAAYTPLSVRYTPEGRTVGSKHFETEVSAVLADTKILINQPLRLLLAGVFDSLAKFVEIKQRFNEDAEEFPLGLDWAYVLSKRSFSQLNSKIEECIEDMSAGKISAAVEQVIFTIISATGVISGIARGSNQCALAHKFYEGTRAMFFEESRTYLHGEIVGVGLLLQNHFNGETENNEFLITLMKKYNMPCRISDIGIPPDENSKKMYFEKLKSGSAIDSENPEELEKLKKGLDYLWELGLNE